MIFSYKQISKDTCINLTAVGPLVCDILSLSEASFVVLKRKYKNEVRVCDRKQIMA